MAMINNDGEIVLPIVISTWRSIHLVMNVEIVKRRQKPVKYFFKMAVISFGGGGRSDRGVKYLEGRAERCVTDPYAFVRPSHTTCNFSFSLFAFRIASNIMVACSKHLKMSGAPPCCTSLSTDLLAVEH